MESPAGPVRTNAIRRPSGDHLGVTANCRSSSRRPVVIRTARPVAESMTAMSEGQSRAQSTSVRDATRRVPSGDQSGVSYRATPAVRRRSAPRGVRR